MVKKLTILSLGVGCGVALLVILLLVKTDLGVSKTFLEKELSSRLGVPVEIERLERSGLYPLKFKGFNIKIANPQGAKGSLAGTLGQVELSFFPSLKIFFKGWQEIFPLHVKMYNSLASFSGDLNYSDEKLQLYNLNFNMGISSIKGQGYYLPQKREVYATVVGQEIFLDDFIKSAVGRSDLLKSWPQWLNAVNGKIHARFDHVYFNGASLSNFGAFLKLKEGRIELDPLSWEMAGGRVFLIHSLRIENGLPVMTVQVAIKDVDLNELLLALHAQNYNRVSGTLYTKASFVMHGRSKKELRQNLTGNGFMQIRNGRFNGPLFSQKAWKAVPLREVSSLFLSERRISDDFTLLQTPFSIEKEKVFTQDIMVFNPDGGIGMEGKGVVEFNSRLKYEGRYYCLLNKYEQYVIPFEVQGTIDRPETSLDIAAASQQSITKAGAKFFIQDDRVRVFNMGVSILDQLMPLLP